MAQAQVRIRTRGRTYASLETWINDVEEKDLPLVLPAVAQDELNESKKAGNPPSNILVDGRPATEASIALATRRVQFFFVDVEIVVQAVELAWHELQRLYRRKTGDAAATIQIWGHSLRSYFGGGPVTNERIGSIGAVRDWLMRHRHPTTYIRLIGPDVPFRRHLYYSPEGAKLRWRNLASLSDLRLAELKKRGAGARMVSRARGAKKIVFQVASSETVSEIVKRRLGGKFGRTVYISTRWYVVPVPSWPKITKRMQGVPAVSIGFRTRGYQMGAPLGG